MAQCRRAGVYHEGRIITGFFLPGYWLSLGPDEIRAGRIFNHSQRRLFSLLLVPFVSIRGGDYRCVLGSASLGHRPQPATPVLPSFTGFTVICPDSPSWTRLDRVLHSNLHRSSRFESVLRGYRILFSTVFNHPRLDWVLAIVTDTHKILRQPNPRWLPQLFSLHQLIRFVTLPLFRPFLRFFLCPPPSLQSPSECLAHSEREKLGKNPKKDWKIMQIHSGGGIRWDWAPDFGSILSYLEARLPSSTLTSPLPSSSESIFKEASG